MRPAQGMEKAPALRALDRIEAALARIENAAPAIIAPPTGDSDARRHDLNHSDLDHLDLERRHADLKQSVARSLSSLDELLAERT